jgi:hypothetical protein
VVICWWICCKTLSLLLLASMVWSWLKLWDVKTLKLLCDVCNRSRCDGCFYLYLAAISGCWYIACVCLNVGVSIANLRGSENFSGGSNSWRFRKLSRRFRTRLTYNSLSVLTCHYLENFSRRFRLWNIVVTVLDLRIFIPPRSPNDYSLFSPNSNPF